MTERVLGPTGGRRRKRLAVFVPFLILAALILAIGASAGTVGLAAGFEDDDGNLADGTVAPYTGTEIDWNNFATVSWTGTAPQRIGTATASGWSFKGVEDWEATTSDSGFAGGTKQDDDCASVVTAKAPNKDDLKRIYLASKTGANGHTYLMLSWVRIPQNTTSPSAHIGFEFNKGNNGACGSGSDGLVKRSAGDMLIVYDFEGGSGDLPVLTLRRWVTSGACEVSNDSAPCWGTATNLTAGGFAEGRVNTFGAVSDAIAPSPPESLGTSEFGEAGIDLTGAGVFTQGVCESFGKAYGVSRSSGNSGTAQMKDLAGPVDFSLTNCGTITIIKQTDPRGLNQSFGYTTTGGLSPSTFSLNDTGNTGKTLGSTAAAQNSSGNTKTYTDVPAGGYTVTEGADPGGFAFYSLTCGSTGTGTSVSTASKTATITLAGGGSVTCVYINKQQIGAIKVTKTGKDKRCLGAADPDANCVSAGVRRLSGVTFQLKKGSTVIGNMAETSTAGVYCTQGLLFGTDYTIQETAAPTGYMIDNSAVSSPITVNASGTCASGAVNAGTYTDTPLSTIQVKFTSLAGAGVTAASIVCKDSSDAAVDAESENGSDDPALDDTYETFGDGTSSLVPDTYTCTVVVDP